MSSPKAKDVTTPEHTDTGIVDQSQSSASGFPGAIRPTFTAAFVKALGGPTGEVVQDVSCSFQRQLGRLYISTDGVFFYSNLFGFERKIRIYYNQILLITKTRTTSLLVKTFEGEEFIFRSFDNRESLLEIIMRYHTNVEPVIDPTIVGDGNNASLVCENSLDEAALACELSMMDNINDDKLTAAHKVDEGEDRTADERFHTDDNPDNSWTTLMQRANQWEPAIVHFINNCKSVNDFFDSYLQDDTDNSLGVFLSDVIGDSNIVVNTWQTDTSKSKSISRTIHYDHKSGVAMAKVTRQQTYHTLDDNRAYLNNVTSIRGIKGVPDDTFFLEDMWFIESTKIGVSLNVKFHVNFTKPTMLRSIIKRRATSEAKDWYIQYASFLRQKIHPSGKQDHVIPHLNSATANTRGFQFLQSLGQMFMFHVPNFYPVLLVLGLAVIIHQLQQRVMFLESSVEELEKRMNALLEMSQFVVKVD